jgi:tetratricopeptide (TPR) repeat protein
VLDRKRVDVLQTLAEIERGSGVVRAVGRRYRFDHHQIQEVVYDGLPLELREEYHSLAARALAETDDVRGRAPDELPAETLLFLASHHIRGSRPRDSLPFLEPTLARLQGAHRHDDALDLADRALAAPGLLEGTVRMNVLLSKSTHLDLLGRRPEERAVLDEALALADAAGDPAPRGRVRGRLGGHLWVTSQFEEADRMLGEAVALAREAGDGEAEADSTGRLGNVCWSRGRYEEALAAYRRCFEIAEVIGHRRTEAMATGSFGLVLMSQGRSEEATEHFQRNMELSREIGDPRGEATAAANLGLILTNLGRFEEARAELELVLGKAREIGYRRVESSTTGNLGNVLLGLGMLDLALEKFRGHRDLAREIGHRPGEASAISNLGAGHVLLGDPARARELLDESRAIAEEIGDRRILGYVIESLGDLAELEGDPTAARRDREECLAVWRGISYSQGVASVLLALGGAEDRDPEEARELLEEAISIGEEIGTVSPVVLGRCRLSPLGATDVEGAIATLERYENRLRHDHRMVARHLLFRATGDEAHLDEAHRLLRELGERSPEEHRAAMMTDVPLHRAIVQEWEERRSR